MTGTERKIWEDALNLYLIYKDKDLEHNAHGICQMAAAACQTLIPKPKSALGLRLERTLVDHFVRRWEKENNQLNLPA